MSKTKAKVPPVPVLDRNPGEIAKDVVVDAKAMGKILGKKDPADQIKEFAVQGKSKNNDQKHKAGTQMLLWAAVTYLFPLASKPADTPDDPPKIHVDKEAPPNCGGSSFVGVFTLMRKLVSKKPEPVSDDEFQAKLDDAGANGDSSSILTKLFNGIRAMHQRITQQHSQISALQRDKNELAAKLVDAGKDLARETSRANQAGVELAKLKTEKEKVETQLKKAKQRSKTSSADSAQDTLTEAEFQLSGCATLLRNWLINELPESWATTDKRIAIMFNGELTAMSPMLAVLELLPRVVDKIMANLKSFLEVNPIEKKKIEATDAKMKACVYAKLLNKVQNSRIAKEALYALIKAVWTAMDGAEVTFEQVETICTEKLLDISDMCVIPMTTADENGTDQYFPKFTEFGLIEGYADLAGTEGVIEVAKLFVNDSWQMRSDRTFIDNLVEKKRTERDARKAEKAIKRAKTSNGGDVTPKVTTADTGAAATAVAAEVPVTETLVDVLKGAADEEAVAVQLLGIRKRQNDESPDGESPAKKLKDSAKDSRKSESPEGA